MTYITHLLVCFSSPMQTPDCHSLWEAVMYFSFFIGFSFFLWAAIGYISYQRKYAAALEAELKRQYIDKEAIAKLSWPEPEFGEPTIGHKQTVYTGSQPPQ